MAKIMHSLIILAAMGCVLMAQTNAFTHIVGGSTGWTIPNSTHFYEDWAKPRTFGVGDKIMFLYRTGVHNVIQVDKENFDDCTQHNAIDMLYKGPTTITLEKKGDYYFYCGVGTHCEAGQKLAITVADGVGSSGAVLLDGAPAPAPDEAKSSANSIFHNLGLASALVCFLVSIFI